MRRWARVAVVVLASCSPPGSTALHDASPVNHPPRVLSTSPGLRTTWFTGTACAARNPTFSLVVSEPDGDPLRGLWFIDGEDTTPFFTTPSFETAEPRTLEAPTAEAFWQALANLPAGTHVVTAWVTDSDFGEVTSSTVTVSRPDGGDGYTDRFSWVLDVQPCP